MHIDRFYEVSQATNMDSFQKLLIGMAAELEFAIVSGSLVIENRVDRSNFQLYSFGNTPQAYLDSSYFSKDAAARDPVARAVKYSSVPFCYDQDIYLKAGAIDLWEEQAAFGYQNGICVGIHLPGHRHFLLGIDRDRELPSDGVEIGRLTADLQLLAMHAQSAAMNLLLPSQSETAPSLSNRELEILKWARDGKTAWETGKIIGISEDGVKYHIRAILIKFDAPNKNQAILRALKFGIL